MSRNAFIVTLALFFLAVGLFNNYPGLDIAVSRFFFDYFGGAFMGASTEAKAARSFFYGLPLTVCVGFVVARWLGPGGRFPAALVPSSRAIIFLTLTMAIGPGLVVNLVFKDNWHRPRPITVKEFGGPLEFRPPWTRDGACEKNCSFVSGETSSAFWLVAPASLAPAPFTVPAVSAALGVGVATSLLRMAFGGHFLSDVVFSALITLLLVLIARLILYPGLREDPPRR